MLIKKLIDSRARGVFYSFGPRILAVRSATMAAAVKAIMPIIVIPVLMVLLRGGG